MRKPIVVVLAMVMAAMLVAMLGGVAGANGFPEHSQCTLDTAGVYMKGDPGRGAICVPGVFYAGGNLAGVCGEIWVADMKVADSDGVDNNANACA